MMKRNEKRMLDLLKKKGKKYGFPLETPSSELANEIVYVRDEVVKVITKEKRWKPSTIACTNTINSLADKGLITLDRSKKTRRSITSINA